MVRAWGFWKASVAAAFATKVSASLRERNEPRRLVLDMSELRPMPDDGQRAFADLVRALPALGVASTSVVTTSHLVKLQLMRIVGEVGEAVIQWLGARPDARTIE